MQNEKMLIKIKAKNADVGRQLERIVRSLEGVQIHGPGARGEIVLLILELGEEKDRDFQDVEMQLSTKAVNEVFVTSCDNSPETLMKVIRTGAKEFLSQPLDDEEVRQALLRCKERRNGSILREPEKAGRIISVIGSKGGVGTTTVAVNLAVSMAERKETLSVALIDMNLLFGEIPIFLEMKPRYHWGEIAKQISRLDSDFLMNILSKHSSGVYVLPSPAYYHYDQEEIPKTIGRVLQLARGMFDVVVIDGGHYLGKISSKALEMSDEVLLLSSMSLPCLSNTNKLLESFRTLGYPGRERVRIVVNRYERSNEISLKEAEESIHHDIFWTLPNEYKVTMTAINQGKPLTQIAPRSSITKSVKRLAESLLGEKQETQENGRWSFLQPWKRSRGRTEDSHLFERRAA